MHGFAISEIVMPPMKIRRIWAFIVLHYSEFVFSHLEIQRFLKIDDFTASEIVLSPMEIQQLLKTTRLHYSEIVFSPKENGRVLKILDFCRRTNYHAEHFKSVSPRLVRSRLLHVQVRAYPQAESYRMLKIVLSPEVRT